MSLRYVVADVFTDRPLEGNPLAVFTDARDLDAETMQAPAREIGFSAALSTAPAGFRASGHDAPHARAPSRRAVTRECLMQIGEAAERVGLSLRTVRFYEEVGLLRPSTRSKGGFRLFSEDDVERLRVMKGMKPMGLPLEQIRELMALFDATEEPASISADTAAAAEARFMQFAALGAEREAKLEQHLEQVRTMRRRIEDRLAEVRAVHGGASARGEAPRT